MKADWFRNGWYVYDDQGHEIIGPFLRKDNAEQWIVAHEKSKEPTREVQ